MIIGVSGLKRSGKDTVAKILTERLRCEKIAFADALRNFVEEVNPLVEHDNPQEPPVYLSSLLWTYGWEEIKDSEYGNAVREILQDYGEGLRKIFGPDIFLRPVARAIEDAEDVGVTLVISDVRYPNEAEMCDFNLHVIRPGTEVDGHPSEGATLPVTHVIYNSGTIEDLARKVNEVVDRLGL